MVNTTLFYANTIFLYALNCTALSEKQNLLRFNVINNTLLI